jgi:hypothetical protein
MEIVSNNLLFYHIHYFNYRQDSSMINLYDYFIIAHWLIFIDVDTNGAK